MKLYGRIIASSLVVLIGTCMTGKVGSPAANAGQVSPPTVSSLRLEVDKPIIHLGEDVRLSGSHFTPGARVAIYLHGPESASLGRAVTSLKVAPNGRFSLRVAIASYPDVAARQWHTVIVAAASNVLVQGVQEGAAVAVQADPMPGLTIVAKAHIVRTSLVIDGTEVPALVSMQDSTHYRISYAGHLRAGLHSAYLKWSDAAGDVGARSWSIRTGSPYAVSAAPVVNLSASRIHLGEDLGLVGNGFTPGARVTFTLGGPNERPHVPVAQALVDATGRFHLSIRIAKYPSAAAGSAGMVAIEIRARGPMVGDLPEEVAMFVQVTH